MNQPLGLSSIHIECLREKLSEWGNPSDSSNEDNGDFIDLWFVDADVFSIYINSIPKDYLSPWCSLYSLSPPENVPKSGAQIDEASKELIDSIAIAVSYFLFGRFRESLSVQSRRFLITPEHERELDAITIAVSFEAQKNIPDQMTALTAHYLELSKTEEVGILTKCIDDIFTLLRNSSPSGKVSRTLDLQQRLLNSMQDTAFFPSEDPRTAFAFRSNGEAFETRVKELAQEAFEIFLDSLIKNNASIEKYAFIKKAVFAYHSPNRRLREYVDHIIKFSKAKPEQYKFDEYTLITQTKQSARQVSDVYAFARLVTLTEFLNTNHKQDDHMWRVNLLTGSHMQRVLKEQWKQQNSSVRQVRLVHPLSVMGVDGFAQPDESLRDQNTEEHYEISGAWALRALKQEDSGEINIEKFLHAFKGLLSSAAVSYAPNRERWMLNLRRKLIGLDHYSRNVYLKSIREAISRDFVSTFSQLNLISSNRRGKLPAVSLPALALPLDSADPSRAEQFVMQLHSNSNVNSPSPNNRRAASLTPPVTDLIKEDPTGYNALLCTGLGYLAQGQDWLRLAESVASTAIAFVSTQVNENSESDFYPQENEALYFAAFVSRMQVDGSAAMRSDAIYWLERHRSLMNRAIEIIKKWEKTEIGRRCVGEPITNRTSDIDITLAQTVLIRYETEQLAANVFGHLIDRLDIADQKLMGESPIDCLVVSRLLAEKWSEVNSLSLKPQYRADVAFTGAQLTASIIQAWLCILADEKKKYDLKDHEKWINNWINTQTKSNPAPGSALVTVLVEIFFSRTQSGKTQNPKLQEAKRDLDRMQFASLDELRSPLFNRLLNDFQTPVSELFQNKN